MYHFSPWIDIPLAVLLYGGALFRILRWVHKPDQLTVKKTPETTRRAAFRLAIVILPLVLICYAVNIAFWLVVVIIPLIDLMGLPVLKLGYPIREFTLGFPELVLSPPDSVGQSPLAVDDPLDQYVGRTARATSSLCPQGTVEIDDLQLGATSASGLLISPGTTLHVTGMRDGQLLVCESSEPAEK